MPRKKAACLRAPRRKEENSPAISKATNMHTDDSIYCLRVIFVKKAFVIIIVIVILGSFTILFAFFKANEVMEQTLLRILFDPAADAIEDYYGEPRQYWEDRLLSVQKIPNASYYKVVMQAETFCGPHGPPYGIETITFYIGYGEVVLKKFEHQDKAF